MTFPQFDILIQFQPKESTELKNKNKFILLILENDYFPYFMDWAHTEKFSESITFLTQADMFRFNAEYAGLDILKRLMSDFMNLKLERHSGINRFRKQIQDIYLNNIELPAALAIGCSYVWNDILRKGQRIHKSKMWASLRKKIIENFKLELITVISDDHYSLYFKEFLSSSAGDVRCLACWRDVRHVIQAIQIFKGSTTEIPSSTSTTTATNVLNEFSTSQIKYSDPYEAMNIMLEYVRKVHPLIVKDSCNGIAKSTILHIADTIETLRSIRKVQSVDITYANEQANILERHLRYIEKETFLYLHGLFEPFVSSEVYVALVSSIRLKQSPAVQKYQRRVSFLQEIMYGQSFPWSVTGGHLFSSYFNLHNSMTLSDSYQVRDNETHFPPRKDTLTAFHTSSEAENPNRRYLLSSYSSEGANEISAALGASGESLLLCEENMKEVVNLGHQSECKELSYCSNCREGIPHLKCDLITSVVLQVSLMVGVSGATDLPTVKMAAEGEGEGVRDPYPNSDSDEIPSIFRGTLCYNLWVTTMPSSNNSLSEKMEDTNENDTLVAHCVDCRKRMVDIRTHRFVADTNDNSGETEVLSDGTRRGSATDDDLGGYIAHICDVACILTSSSTCLDHLTGLSTSSSADGADLTPKSLISDTTTISSAYFGLCELLRTNTIIEPQATSTLPASVSATSSSPAIGHVSHSTATSSGLSSRPRTDSMTPRKTHSKHVSSSIQSSPSIHISSISDHKIVKSKCHAEACRHGKDSTDIYGKKGKDTFQNRELELNSAASVRTITFALSGLPIIETLNKLSNAANSFCTESLELHDSREEFFISRYRGRDSPKDLLRSGLNTIFSYFDLIEGNDDENADSKRDDFRNEKDIEKMRNMSNFIIPLNGVMAHAISINYNWLRWNRHLDSSMYYQLPQEKLVDLYYPLSNEALFGMHCDYASDERQPSFQGSPGVFMCDFSLAEVVHHVSPHLLIEAIMVLLSHRSVVVHSISDDITMKVVIALQMLCYPILLSKCNVMYTNTTKESFATCSSNPFITLDKTSTFLCGMRTDLVAEIIKSQITSQNIEGIDEINLNDTTNEANSHLLNNNNEEAPKDRLFCEYDLHDVTFLDVTSEQIWTSWTSSQYSVNAYNLTMVNKKIFQNFLNHLDACLQSHHTESYSQHLQATLPLEDFQCPEYTCNYNIQKCFRDYIHEILLSHIPPLLQHYPQHYVVACNMNELQANIVKYHVVDSNLKEEQLHEYFHSVLNAPHFRNLLLRHGAALHISDEIK